MTPTNLFSILLAAAVALPVASFRYAQGQSNSSAATRNSVDQDVDLLRKDVRSQKKQIIAANLQLTDAEAEKFWPIYDQ